MVSVLLLPLFTAAVWAQGGFFLRTWGGSGVDRANAIALDSSGNIYVTGYTTSFSTAPLQHKLFLLKFDSVGNLVIQETWNGSLLEERYDLVVDASDNVYLTGSTTSFGNGYDDVIILKFNSQGQLVWQQVWGTANPDRGYGVALDAQGSVYVTGFYNETRLTSSLFLLKFDANGSLLWQRSWGGNYTDGGSDLVVDASGNIFVTGWTNSFDVSKNGQYAQCSLPCTDHVLLKYNSTANLQWQRIWRNSGTVYLSDRSRPSIALDKAGDIYVGGQVCTGNCASYYVDLSKLNSTGGLLWEETWPKTLLLSDDYSADDLTLDSSGNLYIVGQANGNVLFMKLNSNGVPLTIYTWGGSGGNSGEGIVTDASDIPIVTGFVGSPGYTLHTRNDPMSSPSGNITTPAGVSRNLNLNATPVSGTLSTVTGKTGGVFVNYGSTFPVPAFPPLTFILPVGLMLVLMVWRIPRSKLGNSTLRVSK